MDKAAHQKATISGFRWNFLDQILSQGSTFLVGVVLMNFLPPSAFGLVAMATVFTGFLNLFSTFGLSSSLVQASKISKVDIDTVFWFVFFLGMILTIIMFGLSWPMAKLFEQPELVLIIQVLSLNFVLLPFTSVPLSLLQRDLLFSKIFFVNASSAIISAVITIILAIQGWGVWALVFQRVSASIIQLICFSLVVRYIPGKQFSKDILKKHMQFGLPFLGSKSVLYWIENADNFLIGYFMKPSALGLYSRAYALSKIPSHQMGTILFRVLFPSLAKIQDDLGRIRELFLKMNSALLFFITPVMIFVSLSAEAFILLIAGEEWLGSVILLKVLSFTAIVKVNIMLMHNLFLSQGKSKLDFKLNTYLGLLYLLTFFVGALTSLELLVVLYLIASIIALGVWYYKVAEFLKMGLSSFFYPILNVMISCTLILMGWYWLDGLFGEMMNWVEMIVICIYVSICWLSIQMITDQSGTKEHLSLLFRMINNK